MLNSNKQQGEKFILVSQKEQFDRIKVNISTIAFVRYLSYIYLHIIVQLFNWKNTRHPDFSNPELTDPKLTPLFWKMVYCKIWALYHKERTKNTNVTTW